MQMIVDSLRGLWENSGFFGLADWRQFVMIGIACVLLYLGIRKKFDPRLLVGIAFGMLLTNLPVAGLYHPELWSGTSISYADILHDGGFLDYLYIGVKTGIYPSLIFLGVGAMTDFGPLLSNPKSLLLGAAAQFGIYCALILAVVLGFDTNVAAAIAIIGGADGPTSIYVAPAEETPSLPEFAAPGDHKGRPCTPAYRFSSVQKKAAPKDSLFMI